MDDNVGAWLSPQRQRCARVAVNPAQVTTTWAPGCRHNDSVAPALTDNGERGGAARSGERDTRADKLDDLDRRRVTLW